MLPANRQLPIERPPSQIAAAVYIIIGFFALFVTAFVLLYQGALGAITNFRIGLGIVIGLYGLFRIYTGITMIRKAKRMKGSNGQKNPADQTNIREANS